MYLIFQGLVNINKPTQNGKYKTIHQMKSGDFFGDIAFLAGIKRSADVVAVNDSLIGEMTKRNFDEYILENPVIGCKILYHMAGELARRIVNSNHQIEALNSYLNND